MEAVRLFGYVEQHLTTVNPLQACVSTKVGQFHHWRDRLVALHGEVYCAAPDDWRQLFRDNRNKQQWWTFWLAFVILWLSLAATSLAAVSTWAGVVSKDIAAQQAAATQTVFCELNMTALGELLRSLR